jgi:putative flippase GtrA
MRYVVVGGIAFAVDFGTLYALTEFARSHYLVSAAVGFLLGLILNYWLSRAWVFARRTVEKASVEFAVFAIIGVVGLGLNEAILWFGSEVLQQHYLVAKLASAGLVLAWNFGARRALLFSGNEGLAHAFAGRRGGALVFAGVWVSYLLFCFLVQAATGAREAEYVTYPDEPSHFVGAVMSYDWLLSGQWWQPSLYAQEYYRHYPFFAVGYWPPAFVLVTALDFLVAGVGRTQALFVPAIFAALTALLIFSLLARHVNGTVAYCAGFVYLGLPVTQQWMCAVMVDHMTACLCLASAALVLRYLDEPNGRSASLWAVACSAAILSKYSAAYVLLLPVAAVLLLGRFKLLKERSFWLQFVAVGLLVGPWVLWTRHLALYGLPEDRPPLSVARAWSFLAETFYIFPPMLLAIVIVGLVGLVRLPKIAWAPALTLGLLAVGHWSLLFFSPVGAERRYLMAPAAVLLILALLGGTALWPANWRHGAAPHRLRVAAVLLTAALVTTYFGAFSRPRSHQIPDVTSEIHRLGGAAGGLLVPADLEGAFIAEYVSQEKRRPHSVLVRPGKTLAQMNWFGGNYVPHVRTPGEVLDFLDRSRIRLILWHEHPKEEQRIHVRALREMLSENPGRWRRVAWSPGAARALDGWTLYEAVEPGR